MSTFDHGFAWLIGVGADLPVTIQDASVLQAILVDQTRCAYPTKQTLLLTEKEATREGILKGLDWLTATSNQDPDATATVFFSGHGGLSPDYHLVPYGYNPQDLARTAVSGREFTDRLRSIRAKKLLVLLDCCHASGMAEVKDRPFIKSPMPPELSEVLVAGSGRVVIASSRKGEVSYTGTPYSAFTQALREALAGYGAADRDGYAYVADIAIYTGRMVPSRTSDRQHPVLKLSAADNFSVAHYAAGEKTPKPLPGAQSYISALYSVDIDLADRYQEILKTYKRNLSVVDARMAEFYDKAAIPLDLERTRQGILERIAETEKIVEQEAAKSGWVQPDVSPVGPTLEDVMARIDVMHLDLGVQVADLKRGQTAIYHNISNQNQVYVEQIIGAVNQGRLEQGEVAQAVESIRKVLKYVQESNEVTDQGIKYTLDEIYQSVNSNLSFQQQFELSLPVIPFLLDYKVNLGAGVDLGAMWQELLIRIRNRA